MDVDESILCLLCTYKVVSLISQVCQEYYFTVIALKFLQEKFLYLIDLLHHFQEDHMISYLPLSHIAAQMMDIHAQLSTGLTMHFAQPDALKGSLLNTLKACD